MKINEILQYGIKELEKYNIDDKYNKARILLQYILNKEKEYIILNPEENINSILEERYKEEISNIVKGKPLQYITHFQEFMGIAFYIDENVLIPQPDTEILVEETIKEIEQMIIKNKDNKDNKVIRILDLCTGSGAVAISIGKHIKEYKEDRVIEIYASDISEKAVEIAKKNAKLNKVEINFILSDMFQNINQELKNKFDIIVSNPPYIEKESIKQLSKDVQSEPYIALNGGLDGLDFYRIISKDADKFLKKEGIILIEIGYKQKKDVINLFAERKIYKDIDCIKDYAGNDRVIKTRIK